MEAFSIACTTCQARLRVRDESVIGQILTCPKCGSMVLVEPVAAPADPSRSVAPAGPHHLSPSHDGGSRSDFDDAAGLFDEPHEPPPTASPDLTDTVEDLALKAAANRGTQEADIDAAVVRGWKTDPIEDDGADDDVGAELSPPPLPNPEEMLLPNADWASASTVQWRNRVLTGMAAVVGIILALMMLIVFGGGGEAPSIASVPTPKAIVTASGDDVPATIEASEQEDVADNEVSSDATPREATSDDPAQPPIESPVVAPTPIDTKPDPAPIVIEPVVKETAAEHPPGLTPKEPAADPSTSNSTPSPLGETLREFGELLEKTDEAASPMPAVETELPSEADADEMEDASTVRRTGPRVVEIADRLSDPVAQIEFDGVPLANFLRFVSDYSTIPITLDVDALRWLRISPNTAVKFKASKTTVAEILKQGLMPLGLEHRIEGDQLFITRSPRNESGVREVTFKVDDLVGDDAEQLQQLGTRIMDFVAPESWSSRGGIGTITFRGSELVIEQYESVQFEILEFCEKLRVARGLKIRGQTYDASMFPVATRAERARAGLAQSIRLTYLRPAPLQRIVDRIAQSAKLHILIDWRALAEDGWSPDAEVRFSVADKPVAVALPTLLEPMDLAYRVIDATTLQITTPAVLDSRLEVEFYRVSKTDDDGAKLVQAARDALGPTNFRDAGGSGQLAFDKPGNCLLACLSQPQQIELQAWLATRADDAPRDASPDRTTPTATIGNR